MALRMLGLSMITSLLCLAVWLTGGYAADADKDMKSIPVGDSSPEPVS